MNSTTKQILITGGCGYIGSVLTPKLLQLGYQVTVYDAMWFGNFLQPHDNLTIVEGDIRDLDCIPMENIDSVIHLANVANDPCGELNSKLVWEVNALATMGLVEKAIRCGIGQFIYASSGSVYGVKEEEQVTEDLPLAPMSDYNKTKMISERVLLSYSHYLNLQIVRPATVCGVSPRMRLDVAVNMLTMQAVTDKRITVFGGRQTRPNIHIQDIANTFIHFIEHGGEHTGIFNAGFENMSIMGIAEKITAKMPAEIVVLESNDPRSYRLNSDKLLNTGYKPRFVIDNAVNEIKKAYTGGSLTNEDQWHNIKMMKRICAS